MPEAQRPDPKSADRAPDQETVPADPANAADPAENEDRNPEAPVSAPADTGSSDTAPADPTPADTGLPASTGAQFVVVPAEAGGTGLAHEVPGLETLPEGVPEAAPPAPSWQPGAAGSAAEPQPAAEPKPAAEPAPAPPVVTGPESASALTSERLLAPVDRAPVSGWRLWLYRGTFGYVNVGDSDRVRMQRSLRHRVAAPLSERTRYVPVLSRKGGVGKTTVTTLLGMALADIREDRVIAMDANPDRGTLTDRSPGRAKFTARQLVQNRFMVDTFSKLSGYVAREGSRLHVLASDTDPAIAQAFDDSDYRAVTDILSRYYSIVLTDSGTGMVHSVMNGTLEKADAVVLVSGGSVDEARLASETLSWLEAHGRHDLVEKAIVVINMSAGDGTQVNIDEIEQHFLTRVRTVVRLPYDRHLAEGSRVDLARLQRDTREAVVELAALVIDELHD